MSDIPKIFVQVSFQDLQLTEDNPHQKTDIACAIFLNNNCVEKLYLNKDSIGNLVLSNPEDRVRFIFRSKQTGAITGCISFLAKNFFSCANKDFHQWFTLFDCPEDDEFDGEFGEDDDEEPRVLLQYQIKSYIPEDNPRRNSQSVSSGIGSNTNIEGLHDMLVSNASSIVEHGSPLKLTQQISKKERIAENEPIKEANVNYQLQYSFNQDSREATVDGNISKEGSIIGGNMGANKRKGSLEEQITSLVKVLKENRETGEDEKLGQIKRDGNDEGQYLLQLEHERNTKLQEVLKLTEDRLIYMENAYEDLKAKSKAQVQNLVEKNKAMYQENQQLKERIQELDDKIEKVLEKASEQVEAYSEKWSKQLELAAVGDYKGKSEALEKLNVALKEEVSKMKESYEGEKELNCNLEMQMEEMRNKFKEEMNVMKEANKEYNEQMNMLSDDLDKNRQRISELEFRFRNLSALKEAMEHELKIKSDTIENLKSEVEEHRKLGENLKRGLEGFEESHREELDVLRQSIRDFEMKVRKEEKANSELSNQMREMQIEIDYFKAKGYDGRMKALGKEIETYEVVNRSLKEAIGNCKCGIFGGTSEEIRSHIDAGLEREKRAKLEEKIQKLQQEHQEQAQKVQLLDKENFELKERVEDLEREQEENRCSLERMKLMAEENQGLRNLLSNLRNQLSLSATELVNQASQVMNQKEVIRSLNEKVQSMDLNMRGEMRKMNVLPEFQAAKPVENVRKASDPQVVQKLQGGDELRKIKEPMRIRRDRVNNNSMSETRSEIEQNISWEKNIQPREPRKVSESPNTVKLAKENAQTVVESQGMPKVEKLSGEALKQRNIEIDQKLKELMKKTKIPMKFVRIGEGVYVFGSKRVQVRSVGGRLVIKVAGGYIYIEEFIKVYTHQELMKLKTMKGEISYTNIEDEELPLEVDKSQIIYDNNSNNQQTFRDNENAANALFQGTNLFSQARVSEKTTSFGGPRSASISYRSVEPTWPTYGEAEQDVRKEYISNEYGKEQTRLRVPSLKASSSSEFSPKFQRDEEDVKRWSLTNYAEQKSGRENINLKRDGLKK